MPEALAAPRWHVLRNGTVLNEETDPDSGRRFFYQLQSTRPLEPHDLATHDRRALDRSRRLKWLLVVGLVGRVLFSVSILALVAGFVLTQIDAVETVGGAIFWLAIPVGVLSFLVGRVALWRVEKGIRSIQSDAGLVPGMTDEIEHDRGRELIETHGVVFSTERITAV